MLKKKLFWGLLMFVLLALAVCLLSNNQGYVLIVRSPFRVQFSFNFLLFLMVIAFITMHYFLRLIHFLRFLPSDWRKNQAHDRLKESHAALIKTVDALMNDDFKLAEQAAQRAKYLQENKALDEIADALSRKLPPI